MKYRTSSVNKASNYQYREHWFASSAAVKIVKLAVLNMYMCLSLLHDAIWLFRYRFGHNREQHGVRYSNDSDIYVNTDEELTYVVCTGLCQLDNNVPRRDTLHIHTLYNTSKRRQHSCSPTSVYNDHIIYL